MTMPSREEIAAWAQRLPSDFAGMVGMLRERGFAYYRRPLLIAGVPLAAIYLVVYRAPASGLANAQSEIAVLRGVNQYVSRYRDFQRRLESFYTSLPQPKDKDRKRWLTDAVREAMRLEGGVVLKSMSAATERSRSGFTVVSMDLSCQLRYRQLASWVARMERARYPIRITRMSLAKNAGAAGAGIGLNEVQMTVAAVFSGEGEKP